MNHIITELENCITNIEKTENTKVSTTNSNNIRHCLKKWKENAIYDNENNPQGKISTTLNQEDTRTMFLSILNTLMLTNKQLITDKK